MKIIKCVMVGSKYPVEWIMSFLNLIQWCGQNGYAFDYSFTKGSNIYKCRDKAILMNQLEAKDAKPLMGAKYDYILWLDSDQIFSGALIGQLIKADKDIITPLIMTEDGTYSAAWIIDGKEQSEGVKRLTDADVKDKIEPMEVGNIGFGVTLIKHGVYEAVQYPWHCPILTDVSYYSEDRSFFQKAKDKGFKLWLEPTCKAYHIKEIPL